MVCEDAFPPLFVVSPNSMNRISLLPGKDRAIRQGHAWIFSGAVDSIDKPGSVGIARVEDASGKLLGFGFTDPDSQIRCRMFHFGPAPEEGFRLAYWKHRFGTALAARKRWIPMDETDTFRLLHAEGDGLPGLIADVYGGNTVVLVTTLDATGQWISTWTDILHGMGFESVYHRHGSEKTGRWYGPVISELEAREYGLLFGIDPEKGQKTGFFIDQRESRKRIGELSRGCKVLNAFGFSGGFSVHALAGGAREVLTVDISAEACRQAEENVRRNGFESRHRVLTADCFDYLREMDSDFDLVVLDPPAFAKAQANLAQASRGYKDINLSALRRMKPGSLLATFSCSQHMGADLFRKIIHGAACDAGRTLCIREHFHQPSDHPVNLHHPESEYLKGLLLEVIA
jgi:23S rRNA (cytosine1962-C5)-methyltransferase